MEAAKKSFDTLWTRSGHRDDALRYILTGGSLGLTHSAAIRLPSTALEGMGLASDSVPLFNVDPDAQAITLKPDRAKPRYKLSDLMAPRPAHSGERAGSSEANSRSSP